VFERPQRSFIRDAETTAQGSFAAKQSQAKPTPKLLWSSAQNLGGRLASRPTLSRNGGQGIPGQ
jgi:hypothetical protein